MCRQLFSRAQMPRDTGVVNAITKLPECGKKAAIARTTAITHANQPATRVLTPERDDDDDDDAVLL